MRCIFMSLEPEQSCSAAFVLLPSKGSGSREPGQPQHQQDNHLQEQQSIPLPYKYKSKNRAAWYIIQWYKADTVSGVDAGWWLVNKPYCLGTMRHCLQAGTKYFLLFYHVPCFLYELKKKKTSGLYWKGHGNNIFLNHSRVSSFVSLFDNEDLLAFACRAVAPTGFLDAGLIPRILCQYLHWYKQG